MTQEPRTGWALVAENQDLRAEIDRLKAENDMLRGLIIDAPTKEERDELFARRAAPGAKAMNLEQDIKDYCQMQDLVRVCAERAVEIERLQSHAKSMVDALNTDIDAKAAEIERLRANENAQRDGALALIIAGTNQAAEIERLRTDNERTRALVRDVSVTRDTAVNMHLKDTAEVERLRAALADLVGAVTAEVNEKGGGGYILARLSDARAALEPKP